MSAGDSLLPHWNLDAVIVDSLPRFLLIGFSLFILERITADILGFSIIAL